MKILITGGTGLVGKELGKAVVGLGHEVVVVTRDISNTQGRCPYPHEAISWDFENYQNILSEVKVVMHLAGENVGDERWTEDYKNKILKSRQQTTKSLVEAVNDYIPNLQCFISTSGVGIYGDSNAVITEDSALANTFLSKVCKEWERPVLEELKNNVRPVIFRVGVVFSEKGGVLEKMIAPINAGIGGPLGKGSQYMSWIDIGDLVSLYTHAIDAPLSGVYNAVAPEPLTNKELTKKIADHIGKPAFIPVPKFALALAVGEMSTVLLESQKVSSDKLQKEGFRFSCVSVQDSLNKRVPKLGTFETRKIYETWVKKEIDDVFSFFSTEKNLEKMTPPWVGFKVIDKSTKEIERGTLINYRMKVEGIPLRWRTRIENWEPPVQFSDTQLKGPYKKWFHVHSFETLGEGTLMRDQVDYQPPLGPLGSLAACLKIHKDIEKIFSFRNTYIHKVFS